MKKYAIFSASWILLLGLSSCTEEKLVSTPETFVRVKVDLAEGFNNRRVSLYFNQELHFEADLGPSVPLAGPIASFTTSLPRDSNRVRVVWRLHTPNSWYQTDSTIFFIGNADRYYLGLELRNDSLTARVQDSPFLHL